MESNPQSLEFVLLRRALYHCATTAAPRWIDVVSINGHWPGLNRLQQSRNGVKMWTHGMPCKTAWPRRCLRCFHPECWSRSGWPRSGWQWRCRTKKKHAHPIEALTHWYSIKKYRPLATRWSTSCLTKALGSFIDWQNVTLPAYKKEDW